MDGIDFHVDRGEIMGLVGESGCGKSVTSLSIMRLVAKPGNVDAGEILFDGQDLLKLPAEEMRKIRGDRISMVFQQPTSSLNPVWDVGRQIEEVLRIHRGMKGKAAQGRALELLKMVGIPDPERRLKAFPHEMSGGMAQRVMIAMALACEPELLIADEPTTALDVTIQAQILDLMRNLRDETGTAIILITHDLGVVAEMCDRVAVMYAGEIVEETDVVSLFREPLHPYTKGLIGSIPVVGAVKDELAVIPGNVPNLIDLPKGCRFAPRCLDPDRGGRRPRPRRPPRAAARRPRPRRPLLALSRRGRAPPGAPSGRPGGRGMIDPTPAGAAPDVPYASTPAASAATGTTARRGARPRQALPRPGRHPAADDRDGSRRSTASASRSGVARRSASSGSPAAARRRSAGCCSGSSNRPPARSRSTGST